MKRVVIVTIVSAVVLFVCLVLLPSISVASWEFWATVLIPSVVAGVMPLRKMFFPWNVMDAAVLLGCLIFIAGVKLLSVLLVTMALNMLAVGFARKRIRQS